MTLDELRDWAVAHPDMPQATLVLGLLDGSVPVLVQPVCPYCRAEGEPGRDRGAAWEWLAAHTAGCPSHPCRAAEAERDGLRVERDALRDLVRHLWVHCTGLPYAVRCMTTEQKRAWVGLTGDEYAAMVLRGEDDAGHVRGSGEAT